MSALENTRANQNIFSVPTNSRDKVAAIDKPTAAISVTARIDYIQRFSKQLTLVVDNTPAVYSQLSRQYLANISQESGKQENNVAFVAASAKLNDIQMRCRLIEQLFANTLFDPEQSLAVSLSRLAKQTNDTIIIIVEHAQSLSLQIKYELCQLVDVAKKTQHNIHVVLFGLEQAAQEIAKNKSIFDKKTSIVDANSGQVLALDHTRFKNKTELFKNDSWVKISIISLLSIILISFIVLILVEHESFGLSNLPEKAPEIKTTQLTVQNNELDSTPNQIANVAEIHTALLASNISQVLPNLKAENEDILKALAINENSIEKQALENSDNVVTKTDDVAVVPQVTPEAKSNIKPSEINLLNLPFDKDYYLNLEQGYAVQITGFSHLARQKEFIAQHGAMKLYSYQRKLNEHSFIVITTEIYPDKATAMAALNELPQELKALGAFLKSVSIIKHEINTVAR